MTYQDIVRQYDSQVKELTARYELLSFEDVHSELLPHLPKPGGTVLDIGSGSGRDAAWLAKKGFSIVAVDASSGMLSEARHRHPEQDIQWLQDSLPDLQKTIRLGMSFDLILLSAVWMHIKPADRKRVFRKLATLLNPGGIISISLRHGPHPTIDTVYPVSAIQVEQLAIQRGLAVSLVKQTPDHLGRKDVSWETVILRLPDDGTGALPLLRNVIINDSKSSTYKLALLRTLVRVADSTAGLAVVEDEFVRLPLGLVALYWIRLFKPLIENKIPQMPRLKDQRGLSFVKESFHQLSAISPFELRVGASFAGSTAHSLASALKDAAKTIREMPAFYITYPNSKEQVFKTMSSRKRISTVADLTITSDLLWAFGEMHIPLHVWRAFTKHAAWIEPSLMFEWSELMQQYAASHDLDIGINELMNYLRWLDPERDTAFVRQRIEQLIDAGTPVFCTWTGKQLKLERLDIDHCFPFSAWPCNDLWNLLPSERRINQKSKGDKLVTTATLNQARDRIASWWDHAYYSAGTAGLAQRFRREALASLPLLHDATSDDLLDSLFEAMLFKRACLKQDQNLTEWVWKI